MGQLQFGAMLTLAALSTCLVAVSGFPRPQGPGPAGPLPIPRPGADGSYAGDNHFQYINVPAHKTLEWGYRRGNPHHNREEYLSQKDHTFKAKLKWSDEYGGHGEHYYDINHVSAYKEQSTTSLLTPHQSLLMMPAVAKHKM